MAAITRARTTAVPAFVSNFGRVFGMLSAWNDTRATRRSFSGLSDRALEDLGMSRGDVTRNKFPH